jgi:hypothetical protein
MSDGKPRLRIAPEQKAHRDRRARRLWEQAPLHADPAKVARMKAHVDTQLAQLSSERAERAITGEREDLP